MNGDGVADLIVGANGASPNGAHSGQSYVIFGQNFQNITVILDANQLTINQGQTVILTSANLQATSNVQPADTLQIYINTIEHGQFSFVSNSSLPINSFYQQNITNSQVQFTHDGSIYPPDYTVYAQTYIWASTPPEAAIITFGLELINNNGFEINQGGLYVFTKNNLLATNGLGIPDNQITFTISDVQHGGFMQITPGTFIASFTQADINANQIQFVTDGTPNVPSYDVTVSDGGYTLSTVKNGNITFHYAPALTANALSITQGGTVLLNNNGINLKATDAVTPAPELVFSISALQHGHFELVSDSKMVLTNFTQNQVDSIAIQFVQDGSPNAPSYNVSVMNLFGATSKTQAATIAWTPTPTNNTAPPGPPGPPGPATQSPPGPATQSPPGPPQVIFHDTNNNHLTRNILIGTCVSAVSLAALILCYVSMGYLKKYRLNAVANNKGGEEAEYYRNTIILIAREIFDTIKVTGFMNYIGNEHMKEYVAAIVNVVHEIRD